MKRIAFGLAAVLLSISAASAMDPAKTMDTSAGKVWTDDKGMTLYVFDKDAANKSSCYDQCAKNWPPLMAAGDAMASGDWTIVKRDDGTTMWAYDGHPLYTFVKDAKPGDVAGDGVGGVWHAAKAD
jgi:predicted lipoprotein with Yx(FWY)xxD motif